MLTQSSATTNKSTRRYKLIMKMFFSACCFLPTLPFLSQLVYRGAVRGRESLNTESGGSVTLKVRTVSQAGSSGRNVIAEGWGLLFVYVLSLWETGSRGSQLIADAPGRSILLFWNVSRCKENWRIHFLHFLFFFFFLSHESILSVISFSSFPLVDVSD